MALLPARRNGTLSRPGSQAPARWDPFAESGDLYQRMGQLLSGASGDGWQPLAQSWALLADPRETDEATWPRPGCPAWPGTTSASSWPARNWSSAASSATPASTAGRCAAGGARAGPGTGRCPPRPRDKVTAALAHGVLTVTVPKAEAGKPHRIQITAC